MQRCQGWDVCSASFAGVFCRHLLLSVSLSCRRTPLLCCSAARAYCMCTCLLYRCTDCVSALLLCGLYADTGLRARPIGLRDLLITNSLRCQHSRHHLFVSHHLTHCLFCNCLTAWGEHSVIYQYIFMYT